MTGDRATEAGTPNNPTQQEARNTLGQLAFNPKDNAPASSSAVERYAEVTGKGLVELPFGLAQAVVDDISHPLETGKMLLSSAALGAALKVALPEGGPVGLVAGLAVGGYFLAKGAAPMIDAYKHAGSAKTQGELNGAAIELGNAGGAFIVNSGVGMAGYKIGAGLAGRALASEPMDGFAQAKANFYGGLDSKFTSATEAIKGTFMKTDGAAIPRAESVGLASNLIINGDRATLLSSDRTAPEGKLIGDVNPADEMHVTVLAKTKGSPFLMDRYINRIANGAKPLTDAEIEAKFGTDPTSGAAITKFAADHNLTIADTNPMSGRFILKGSAENMQNAFGVKLQEFQQNDVTFRGRTGTLSVPTEVAPHIKGVLGLDNRPQFHTNYVKLSDLPPGAAQADAIVANAATPNAGGARAVDVSEVFKAYNADPKLQGAGQTGAFLSLGGDMMDAQGADTWAAHLKSQGIDPKLFEVRNIPGNTTTSDPGGANGENWLDAVVHKEGAPKAKTVMVTAPNSDSGMPDGIDRMTFPKAGESQITHASISWGMFEDGWTKQAQAAMEDAGKRAALKGITITVASGDNGVGDGSRSGKPQVDVPAGLEHVTGVGGTQLILNADGTWSSEKTWSGMGATGGGRSLQTPRPTWQADVKMPDNLGGSKFDGRGVPDIAANADPRSGYNVATFGPIGGTSGSAPAEIVAAMKISEGTGQNTGFWNPTLYKLGKSNPEVYHDVTVGNNSDAGMKGYPAGPGWDASTGWGSINIGKYIDVIGKQNGRSVFARELGQVPDYMGQTSPTQVSPFNFSDAPSFVPSRLQFVPRLLNKVDLGVPFQTSVVNDQQENK